MPRLPQGEAAARLEQVRLATGDAEKSDMFLPLVALGQSRQLKVLDDKAKHVDFDVQSLKRSRQEFQEALDKSVSSMTKREEDAMSKIDQIQAQVEESIKRQKVTDTKYLEISRDQEDMKTRLDTYNHTLDARDKVYHKAMAQVKVEVKHEYEVVRGKLAQLHKQLQGIQDAYQTFTAEQTNARLQIGRLRTRSYPKACKLTMTAQKPPVR